MTLAEMSSLGIVASAVVYLIAFTLHALEWSTARGLSAERGNSSSEDATRRRVDSFGRMGLSVTAIGVVLHVMGVVTRGLAAHRLPWGNMYEFVTSAMAFAAVAYLFLAWRFKMRWLGLPITLVLSVMNGLAATAWYTAIGPLVPALHSVWFIIHIVSACICAAAFNLGAAASSLYLLKLRAEEKADGQPLTGFLARVPSLNGLDLVAYRLHAFAFPLWTFTIAAGAVWAEYAWGRFWGWDPKETWSLVTWVVYAAYLHARATAGWRGRNAAIVALVGVAVFWFNFVGVNLLISGLHSYAGI